MMDYINQLTELRANSTDSTLIRNSLRYVGMDPNGMQYEVYMKIGSHDTDNEYEKKGAAYSNELIVQTFVFPDGSFGSSGASKWIFKDTDGNYYPTNQLYREHNLSWWLRHHIIQLSVSWWYIIRDLTIVCAPYGSYKGSRFGIGGTYVIEPLVEAGGAPVLGLALEVADLFDGNTMQYVSNIPKYIRYRGYTAFGDSDDPYERLGTESGADVSKLRIKSSFEIRPRYALIDGSITLPEVEKILSLYNHPDNWHKQYLNAIFVSKSSQTGINLVGTARVYETRPAWNSGSKNQALYRALRIDSHDKEIEELELMKLEQRTKGLYRDYKFPDKFEVCVNMMCVTIPNGVTINQLLYERVDKRSRIAAVPKRAYKIVAVDNIIQRDRNILSDQLDNTEYCDYDTCNYPTISPIPTNIDYSTYDIYYQDDIVRRLEPLIRKHFVYNNVSTFEELIIKFGALPNHIIITLNHIISTGIALIDRFGFKCYLRQKDGVFFTTRSSIAAEPNISYDVSYYNSNLIGVSEGTLSEVLREGISKQVTLLLQETGPILNITINELRAKLDILGSTSILDRIRFIEKSVELGINDLIDAIRKVDYVISMLETSDNPEQLINDLQSNIFPDYSTRVFAVLWLYQTSIFATYEPVHHISHIQELINKGASAATIEKNCEYNSTNESLYTMSANKESTVIVHDMYAELPQRRHGGSSAKIANVQGNIRIFKIDERRWRNVRDNERCSYRLFLRKMRGEMASEYDRKFSSYGTWITKGQGMKIVRRTLEPGSSATMIRSSRRTGIVCDTMQITVILYHMYTLGINLPLLTNDNGRDELRSIQDKMFKGMDVTDEVRKKAVKGAYSTSKNINKLDPDIYGLKILRKNPEGKIEPQRQYIDNNFAFYLYKYTYIYKSPKISGEAGNVRKRSVVHY